VIIRPGKNRIRASSYTATVARLLAGIAVAALLPCLVAGRADAGRRVTVTKEMIRVLGASRLSDLFVTDDAWSPQSNDAYTFSPTPRGLSLPRAAGWSVFLNGQPVDAGVFDVLHLEMIPVALAEIDSVVFADECAPGTSWTSARGRIEIFTGRPQSGWQAGGAASAAHKTGAGATTIGPDGALWMSRGSAGWYAALSASLAEHPYNDPAMRARTGAAMRDLRPGATEPGSDATSWFYDATTPALLRTSVALRGGVKAGTGWHDGLISIQNARRYFHYSEPFGRELPTDQYLATFSATGRALLTSGLTAGYRASFAQSRLSDQDEVLAFEYGWKETRSRGALDVTRANGVSRVMLFAGVEDRRVSTGDTLSRDADTIVRAGIDAQRRVGRNWTAGIDAAGTFSDGDAAAALGATADWVVRPADTLRARVRMTQRLFVEDDNLWLWSERGYGLLARNGVAYSIDGAIDRTTVVSADIGWTSVGVLGGVDVDLGIRRFDDAYVEQRDFSYDPSTCSFTSPTRIATGRSGNVGLMQARLWHALGGRTWADFSWTYYEEFNSDAAFSRLWQTVPRHRISYTLHGRIGQAWRMRLRIAHASSTFWPDYAGVDGATCVTDGVSVTYRANVPGYTTVDAGVQVVAWRERATIDIVARNLFDTAIRNHPAGASQPLTLGVQLVLHGYAR